MVAKHLRSNVVGYVALFIALSAGAYAAGLPKNSVKSKQIKDGQVRAADLAADSVDGSKVADGSLRAADIVGGLPGDSGPQILGKLAAVDGSGSGLDADSLDGLGAADLIARGGAAGGDLTGTYPDPAVGPNAVGGAEIANGTVGPDDQAPVLAARLATTTELPLCNSTSAGVLSGSTTAVAWVDERFDQGGLHAQSPCAETTKLTVPRAGIYLVSAGVVWNAGLATGKRSLSIRDNTGAHLVQDEYDAASSGSTLQNVSTLVRMAGGQYVETVIGQTSGEGLALTNDDRTFFAIAWLGP